MKKLKEILYKKHNAKYLIWSLTGSALLSLLLTTTGCVGYITPSGETVISGPSVVVDPSPVVIVPGPYYPGPYYYGWHGGYYHHERGRR